jgi:hypothetical protein
MTLRRSSKTTYSNSRVTSAGVRRKLRTRNSAFKYLTVKIAS